MRFGIVGMGWAGCLRAEAIGALAGFDLVALCDQDEGRRNEAARKYGADPVADWRALVQRPDIDAVIVASPPNHHREIAVGAFENAKHVLCEKPLAPTPQDCEAMIAAAEKSGKSLATGFNYRFYPAVRKARELLDGGAIGALDHIRSYAGHPGGEEFTHAWVHDPGVMGGGTLMDNGIHIIDLTLYFLGGVSGVCGASSNKVWRFEGCEDNGFALVKNENGNIAALQASWSEWRGYRFFVEIYGTEGYIRLSYPPMLTVVGKKAGRGGRVQRKIYAFPKHQVLERLRSPTWTARTSFERELREFEKLTQGRPAALATGYDGAAAVNVAHAAYDATQMKSPGLRPS